MQVQKSAKHYTEAAEDEIKLLTVCVRTFVPRKCEHDHTSKLYFRPVLLSVAVRED